MSTPVISSLSYKDTSDDEVDAVLTKLKCPRNPVSCLEVTMSPPSVATRISHGILRSLQLPRKAKPSKKARAI
jgi:hypothetical protein